MTTKLNEKDIAQIKAKHIKEMSRYRNTKRFLWGTAFAVFAIHVPLIIRSII